MRIGRLWLTLGLLSLSAACGEQPAADPDPCAGWSCGNGRCAALDGRPVCVCDPGYGGASCEIPPVCTPNPCTSGHRTVCAELDGAAACLCEEGFHDDGAGGCAPVVDDCAGAPCIEPSRNVCALVDGVAVCLCNEGYFDDDGECRPIPDSPCDPNPCAEANRSTCEVVADTAVCRCDPGFHDDGEACVPDDPCTPNPCDQPNRGTCVAAGDSAECVCDPGFVDDSAGGCVEEPPSDCTTSHTDGDSFEPDECPALATLVEVGVGQQHSISPSGDLDWLAFEAEADHIYRIEVTLDSLPESSLQLLDQDGTTVLASTRYNTITRELAAAGRYYVRVDGYSAYWDEYRTGTYTVTVTDLGLDDHGDTSAAATPVVPDAAATAGDLETRGDLDWFSFDAEAGHIYRVDVTPGSLHVCTLRLVDQDGSTVIASTRFGTITREIAAAGRLYVQMDSYSAYWDEHDTGTYTISVTDLGLDDHADTSAAATPIVPGAAATAGDLETNGDLDWFSFDAEAGHIYRIDVTPGSLHVCTLRLVDQDGSTVLASTRFGTITREIAAAGRLYVQMDSYSAYWDEHDTGTYTISVTDLGLDDHADTSAAATAIVPGAAATAGDLETYGDLDWFAFDAEAGHSYRVDVTLGSLHTYTLRLVDQDGSTVLAATRFDSITHEVAAAGRVHVEMDSYSAYWGERDTGTYTISVTDLGL